MSLLGLLILSIISCTFPPFGAQTPPQSPLQIEALRILDEPLAGQPFRVEIPIVLHVQVPLSPVNLTLTIPSSLNFVGLESEGQVVSQREGMIHLPDPVGWGEIETKGYVISINLGAMGGAEREGRKTVLLTMRVVTAGEWQIEVRIKSPTESPRSYWGDTERIVGWSTPSRAVWENFEDVEKRWLKEEGRQCRGGEPCLVVYPEEPLHYFLGISEKEMPGQLLRPRAAKMCGDSVDLSACLDLNTPLVIPTTGAGFGAHVAATPTW